MQIFELLRACRFQRRDLGRAQAVLAQLLLFGGGVGEGIGGRVVAVGGVTDHRTGARIDRGDHRIAQAPVTAEGIAGAAQGLLAADLGIRALQGRRLPQGQQLFFGAHIAGLVAVVVDQVATRFDVHIAPTGGHLVDPQVARGLLECNAACRRGRDATTRRVFGLDVEGGLDRAIGVETANAPARRRNFDAAARHMHLAGVHAHNVLVAEQPNLARGRDLVDAQGTAQALKGDVALGGGGCERAGAGDHVDRAALAADAGGGVKAQIVARDRGAAAELLDRAQ